MEMGNRLAVVRLGKEENQEIRRCGYKGQPGGFLMLVEMFCIF